jgi:hypothetical protein
MDGDTPVDATGECRIGPPAVVVVVEGFGRPRAFWPALCGSQWCGEHPDFHLEGEEDDDDED